jgi:hypothetical protein
MPMALPKQPQKLLLGALAGIIATVPMTFVMTIWHRRLPWWQRYPLPPRIITDRLLTRAPLPSGLVPPPSPGRALAAHFAFGAAAGSIYACLSPALRHRYPLQAGVLYALGIWGGSYLGWVPATGAMAPATRQPMARTAMMIAAHIVWGATLGSTMRSLCTPERRKYPDMQSTRVRAKVGPNRLTPRPIYRSIRRMPPLSHR